LSAPASPVRMCLVADHALAAAEECVPLAAVVFSGGTAFNSVASAFSGLTTRVTHVLPVSDDGGSTAEIVRVLSGPAVGDIRSRCLRLADSSDPESLAVKRLLGHRLHPTDAREAKREWTDIVEGEHALWENVSHPYKHTIRAFLVHFHTQILSHATERFNFANGSVGNFFFAGARIFFRSLEAAIFLFSRVARIPEGTLVLPVICTEERITLGAELEDGTVVRGQNEISHPAARGSAAVDKATTAKLPSRVKRIFYLSSDGDHQEHEVFPTANPQVVSQLGGADVIVYGMGSLYTSICPTLILNGVGEAIAGSGAAKVLVLNGFHDRETGGCQSDPRSMSASDIVQAVCNALNRTYAHTARGARLHHSPASYITALVVPAGAGLGAIAVDSAELADMGVAHVEEVATRVGADGRALYAPDALVEGIENIVLAHQEAALLEAAP